MLLKLTNRFYNSFSLLNCNRYQVFMLHSNMQTSDQKKVLKNPPAGVRKIVSIIRSFMFYFCYSLVYFHINLKITFHFRSFPPILLKQASLSMMLSLLLILVKWRRYVWISYVCTKWRRLNSSPTTTLVKLHFRCRFLYRWI